MTQLKNPSRRKFLQTSAATGGALVIGVSLSSVMGEAQAATDSAMNAWVRVGSDNTVTILVDRSEMGQGVVMALPMLVAEELEVDLNKVKVEFAPPGEMYINAMLGGQITGGSTSVRDGWEKLRVAGAKARVMLTEAAAQKWGVSASDCKAANGMVTCKGKKATYGSLAEAASKLTPPKEVALKDPSKWRYVGKPLHRLDTPGKITGKTQFGIDTKLPGMLYAALAQCPVIGGKATAVDDAKAKSMPGVKHVVKVTDGVAVVADSWWQAKQARDALNITWDEGPMKGLSSEGVFKQLADAMAKPGASIKQQGNVDDAMKGAAKTVEATYQMPFLSHSPMEPMNFTADVKKDSALLIGSIQFQQAALGIASAMTKLKPEQITIKTTFLGGGFGRRIDLDYMMQAVEISMAVGAPVKLVWTREDDVTHDFYRPASLHRLSAGLDSGGKPVAISHKMSSPSITSRLFPPVVKDGVDPFMAEAIVVPYDIANQSVHTVIHEPGLRVGYLRSVSHALNVFANESFVDEMAAAAGKDPVEFRLAMLGKQPRHANVLKIAAEKAGWGKPLPKGHARGVALMEGYETYMAQVAEVSVQGGDIKVHRVTVAVDLGRMVNPNIVQQQLESNIVFGLTALLYGDITLKDGRVQQTNFDTYKLLRINEMPKIDMHIVKSTEKPGGIGEPGMALISPAVANAVFTLTGKRLRQMPLRVA
ncbi:MAG TPA: xanthine dehydrogenase family protein molybdopterin-binding subunit [Burkholderiales bacterium]|jgi:isoquinoline 1-oxidoreductase beta subunit|nr:xanthine dehydrogenase family protein molybdopterin-binding subunit [Burkholderiales bacterium]